MHHNCAVCFEVASYALARFSLNSKKLHFLDWYSLTCFLVQFLFDSMKNITVLQCGHTIHLACVQEMELHRRSANPCFSYFSLWRFISRTIHVSVLDFQILMPRLLQVHLRHVKCMEKA